MKPINKILTKGLTWRQPAWSREYFELSTTGKPETPEDLLATLSWTRWLSDEAIAITQRGRWLFDRVGFLDRKTIVLDANSEDEVAQVVFNWLGDGIISFSSGNSFSWFRSRTFKPAWIIADSDEEPIFEIELGFHWFKQEAVVRLDQVGSSVDEFSILLPLGFYLGVCAQRDAAAVVGATSAAAVT
jgi:hypothetical protein